MNIFTIPLTNKPHLDGNGQTITLEQTITKKKPKTPKTGFGAQATNKPLRKINLSNSTPYCFEVKNLHFNSELCSVKYRLYTWRYVTFMTGLYVVVFILNANEIDC